MGGDGKGEKLEVLLALTPALLPRATVGDAGTSTNFRIRVAVTVIGHLAAYEDRRIMPNPCHAPGCPA
ncbi:MAG: hypothetical protein JWR69_195 [Pedosphaera sp.]|nr:hypothetical protein [Pedosphaera sp.]